MLISDEGRRGRCARHLGLHPQLRNVEFVRSIRNLLEQRMFGQGRYRVRDVDGRVWHERMSKKSSHQRQGHTAFAGQGHSSAKDCRRLLKKE